MFAVVFMRGAERDARAIASPEQLLGALTPYDQADQTGDWSNGHLLIVQALTFNTASSQHEQTPTRCAETGRVIAAWARLDNRAELAAALGLDLNDSCTDPVLILAAHRKWGGDCASRLEGDFSFVIYDPARDDLFAARDSLGARPLFYSIDNNRAVIATTAALFQALNEPSPTPSREWIARNFIGQQTDTSKTAYENIWKLPPAHHLRVEKSGTSKPVEYFTFEDTAPWHTERDDRWLAPYRDAFHRATETRLRSAYLVGAESSGGLDSSTIIAHAAKKTWHGIPDFHCFGICHLEQEPEVILQTALYCGLKHTHILTTPDYHTEAAHLTRAIKTLGYPPEHRHATFHIPLFELCTQLGVRTLLSGYGGDEIVTNQAGFLGREYLRRGAYGALLRELPGPAPMRALRLVRMLARQGLRGQRPFPPAPPTPLFAQNILRRDVLEAFGLDEIWPSRERNRNAARSVNELLLGNPAFKTMRVGRLEGCAVIANSYKIEYRWPLFDRQLIAQYLRTPAVEKRSRHLGRYLHRRACEGTIPEQILWKPGKDLGGFVNFDPERKLAPPNVEVTAFPLIADLIDTQKLNQHINALKLAQSDMTQWANSHAQRNSLRILGEMCHWINVL